MAKTLTNPADSNTPTVNETAPAPAAPWSDVERSTIYQLGTASPYALGESSKMSNGWTSPTSTNGDWAVTLYGSDAEVVADSVGSKRRVTLPDGGIRFLSATLAEHQAVLANIQGARARKSVITTDSISVESTVCRVDDAVRGPADQSAIAAVPNRNFPLLALRVSRPTDVILERDKVTGKRRMIIEID